MKIEYLAVIPSDNPFCQDSEALKNFLQSDSQIKIVGKKIKHDSFEVNFELQEGHNEEKKHRFYHLRLNTDSNDIERLSKMGRAIRTLLHLASKGNVQVLWDDISFHYTQISYPHIHEIENLMRKLITKFMLTNVGLGWAKETTPEEVKKSSRTEASEINSNYLYELDFIQLSNFLFNAYRTQEINVLIKKISETQEETIRISEISELIPKSNWKRYFEPYVDCDATYLQSRWEKLYDLRCKIAHNNFFTKSDHEQTLKISSEVKEKIEKAIKSLDEISVPENEREELAESVASQSNTGTAAFLAKWKMIEKLAREITIVHNEISPTEQINPKSNYQLFTSLVNTKLIDAFTYRNIREAQKLRNTLVHEYHNPFTDTELIVLSKELDEIVDSLYATLLFLREQQRQRALNNGKPTKGGSAAEKDEEN